MSAPLVRAAVRRAAILVGFALTAASAAVAGPSQGVVRPARAVTASVMTPVADPWHQARALADAARYDSALAVLRVALAREGGDVELRWLQAGITGEAGRHREAVTLYERLMAEHPDRADELRADLAEERLSVARELGWNGHHAQAIAAYREILAADPDAAEARLGIAMNENWQGRHRRAARLLEALGREPAADPEALKALAFARYWDDDPDGARQALDDYGRRVPDDSEARDLAARIADERSASLRVEGGRADDTDGLRVRTTGMELSWPLARGTAGVVGWRRDNLMDAGGTADPLRLSAGLRARLDAVWSAYGTFAHTDWGDGPGVKPGGELGVVCRPVDRVRLEALVSREPVLTRRSLALGISLLGWTGVVDLSPTERLTLHAVAREGIYSDHNRAERVAAEARLRVVADPRGELALTLGAEQLNAHQDLDHGYYAPDFLREWGPGAEAEWHPSEEWTLGASGQVGRQQEKGSEAESFYALGGRVEVIFARLLTLALEGGRGDSSLQSEGGYRRAWWQASLARRF